MSIRHSEWGLSGRGAGGRMAERGEGAKLCMICWNVCGWSRKDGGEMSMMRVVNDIRAKVLDH